MLNLRNILQLVIHSLNDSPLPEKQFVGHGHQSPLHVAFEFRDKLYAIHKKSFEKVLLSRWYLRFLSALNENFAICASKTLQKSSVIQKISVTLCSVFIAESFSFVVFVHYKVFRKLKGTPKKSANYQISNELFSSNSR